MDIFLPALLPFQRPRDSNSKIGTLIRAGLISCWTILNGVLNIIRIASCDSAQCSLTSTILCSSYQNPEQSLQDITYVVLTCGSRGYVYMYIFTYKQMYVCMYVCMYVVGTDLQIGYCTFNVSHILSETVNQVPHSLSICESLQTL